MFDGSGLFSSNLSSARSRVVIITSGNDACAFSNCRNELYLSLTSLFFRLVVIEEENDMDSSPTKWMNRSGRALILSFPAKLSSLSLLHSFSSIRRACMGSFDG